MMVWKKIPSLVIISLLITSGLAIIGSQTGRAEEGEQVHTIDFGVTFDTESAIESIYEGERDLLMDITDGLVYQNLPEEWCMRLDTWEVRTSYNNLFINPAHEGYGTQAIDDAIERGWIEEPEEVQWLANNTDGEWTVNPFAHEDIRFALQYLNRKKIVDELLDGYGDPRYSFMDTESDLWQDHFVDTIPEKYNMSAEGNLELMEQMIEDAMEEIKQNVAFGEVRFEDEHWQYKAPEGNWHDIEIIICYRAEDWREELAYYIVDGLQGLGFNAEMDMLMYRIGVFYGSPEPYDNLAYHIYTGRWISAQSEYYQEKRVSQYYAPWYGFVQVWGDDSHWQYDQEGYTDRVRRLDNLSKELYQGRLESEEEYWKKMVEATQLGIKESVRVFLLTEKSVYPYDPNSVINAVPESINGYDTYFGPRTMRTDDGELAADIITGEDRPYWDNWNMEGGSADRWGEYQRGLAKEYGTWNHPQTGKPMQVNNYWMDNTELENRKPERTHPYDINGSVEKDFEYQNGTLIENIEVPMTEAVDYIPAYVEDLNLTWDSDNEIWRATPIYNVTREWKTAEWINNTQEAVLTENETILTDSSATEAELIEYEPLQAGLGDRKAAVKVTIDSHTEHVWHDGTPMKFRDIMHHYARRKELGDPGTEPYRDKTEASLGPKWDSIYGIEWNAAEGTYTIWGDYTLPIDDKIGNHYSMYPWDAHPLTYTGWNQLVAEGGYSYDAVEGTEWIHQLSTSMSEDMIAALQAMDVPPYLNETNFAGSMSSSLAMTQSEMDTMISSFDSFVNETKHSFIGLGPFRIDIYDATNHDMQITRWEQYGFPFEGEEANSVEFPYGYWPAQFELQEVRLDSIETLDLVELGEEFKASGIGHYAHLYPEPEKAALTEDHLDDYRFTLRDGYKGEILVEIPSEDIDFTPEDGFSSFEAMIPTEDIESEGNYTLQLEILEGGEEGYITAGKIITLTEDEPYFDLNIIRYLAEVEKDETLTVEYKVNNTGGAGDTQDMNFTIDGETIDAHTSITLSPGENKTGEFTWEGSEAGKYEIEIASEDDKDTVTVTVKEEEEELIPGFALSSLVVASLISAVWYQRKIKDRSERR